MRKKLSLFLVMLMALTMVLGTGITAMAADLPQGGAPLSVRPCHETTTGSLFYVITENDGTGYAIAECYDLYGNWRGTDPSRMAVGGFRSPIIEGRVYHMGLGGLYLCENNSPLDPGSNGSGSSQAHTHNYQYQVLQAPSVGADGEEAEVCTICGDIRNRQPISAMGYALYDYAVPMINASKPGQTITFEFGELNSFPKSFMEKLVDKSAQNVTFVFKYKWNHKLQKITIPAGTPIDLNFDYYGPAKMAELYGMY